MPIHTKLLLTPYSPNPEAEHRRFWAAKLTRPIDDPITPIPDDADDEKPCHIFCEHCGKSCEHRRKIYKHRKNFRDGRTSFTGVNL